MDDMKRMQHRYRNLSCVSCLSWFLTVVWMSAFAGPGSSSIHAFEVLLDAAQQVPTNASPGTGAGTVTFDEVSNELSWNVAWTNLTGPATGMHFHGPAGVGTNAGVRVNIGLVSGLTSPTAGSTTISPAFGSELLAGMWYVNIHTAAHGPGEIRGQVLAAPSAPDVDLLLGDLAPGETVEVEFEVVIQEPFPVGVTSVTNQATISGSNFAATVTGDPSTTNENDVTVTVLPPDLDFGDAPSSFPVLLAEDGARHVVPFSTQIVFMGSIVDIETNGFPSIDATGDDFDNFADEDGVILPANLVADSMADVTVIASTGGYLSAWIDFDTNGVWDVPADQIFSNELLAAGANDLMFAVPASATDSVTYARFRFSTATNLLTTGQAPDGEVEDYEVILITTETIVEVVGNDLVVTDIVGSGKDDTLLLTISGTNIVVVDTNSVLSSTTATVVGQNQVNVPLVSISGEIRFDLIGGNDEATVDFYFSSFGAPIFVDGGDGTDAVIVQGTMGNDTFYVADGLITSIFDDVSWSNTEEVIVVGGAGEDTFWSLSGDKTLDGGADDDTYLFTPDWGTDWIVEEPGGGFDTMDFSGISQQLDVSVSSIIVTEDANAAMHASQEIESLITGSGIDTVDVKGYTNALTVDTIGGSDTVNLGDAGSMDNVTGAIVLDGGTGFDRLNLLDGDDADMNSYTFGPGSFQRSGAAEITYANFETFEATINNDDVGGTIGDGSGGVFWALIEVNGGNQVSGDLLIQGDGRFDIGTNMVLIGGGSITNRGLIFAATNDLVFEPSLSMEGGGSILGLSDPLLAMDGDFSNMSGNPTFELRNGGVIFSSGKTHMLSANSVDMGPVLPALVDGNRVIGTLVADGDVEITGTVYVIAIEGSGNITVHDGAVVYYLSNSDWTGTLVVPGSGIFQQVEAFFTSIAGHGGMLIGEFDAAPDLIFEVFGTDDPVVGTYQLVTGFVGTATSEWFTDDTSTSSNRIYKLEVSP